MEYRRLGNTGAHVSQICLGCMSYGSAEWRPWVLDRDAAAPFFRAAVEAGINFFDTANMYSLGESETVTGHWLREYANRDEVVLATKVFFPINDRPNMGGLSRKHVQQACEASLRRLGVETIDLYQIHRLDPRTPVDEMLEGLDALVRQGKVRYLGASSMYAWELMRCLAGADARGLSRFVSMQGHYNLVYREEEREMLPLCRAEGIGVIPWSPLARGMLAGSRQKLGDDSTTRSKSDGFDQVLYDQPSDWDVVAAVKQVAEARGAKPAQVALAWLMSRPGVTAPIVGATKLAHLEDAVSATEIELSDDEVAALEAPYRPHPVKGLGPAALRGPR
ncbi:MAG: aldo/keto reductase [Deltaproteobacteria bacterium]|nr:aldo/keto reductase [Deltaproteobacteria bacterium]MBW2447180.1 aldo/keto reductase [Deltaproteobacteria bacterium]